MKALRTLIIITILFVITPSLTIAVTHGTIKGQATDLETGEPLPGASVMIRGTTRGGNTDAQGFFTIADVAVGGYVLEVRYVGYEPVVKTDVIVRSERITTVNFGLREQAIEIGEVNIAPRYFAATEDKPVGTTHLSREEIRRAPGSVGDLSRVLMALPGVAKVNDTRNNLVVRGGSPLENGYYVDGMPVSNINHFPQQGSSGGALGLLNVDFIEDVQFYTGGFSVAYGDRLSSVTDITLREGNRDEFDGQLDLSVLGAGAQFEGPLGERGSWMVSGHRSYFDLIIREANVEASTIPNYGNVQGKVCWDVSPTHQLEMLQILGLDHSRIAKSLALENREDTYGRGDWSSYAGGMGWRWMWGKRGYSRTTLSRSRVGWDMEWPKTKNDSLLDATQSTEAEWTLRNTEHVILNDHWRMNSGIEGRLLTADNNTVYGAHLDPFGSEVPEIRVAGEEQSVKLGAFLAWQWRPALRWRLTFGSRLDYFDYTEHTTVSPRLQVDYDWTASTSFTAACGRFQQSLPLVLLQQNSTFRDLTDPSADHYILGMRQLLSANTQMTVEVYEKRYSNMPLDPATPSLFVIDESYREGGFSGHTALTDNGRAFARGVELLIQKKLATQLHGVISGSWSKTQYRGCNKVWHNRRYDNQLMFTVEGGYKPNRNWEFGVRWVFAGGVPYTPFDEAASVAAGEGIADENRVYGDRLPNYHALDVRVDRRFHFRRTNLIVYLAAWNVYNRENVAGYSWSELDNRRTESHQWGFLPAFGLEFEY
ncbi:TonB-dependent receptor [bacterium]|nr:TonB-dependent receptor [bacterium]MBU1982835.1 TonB-dependent receptor [bacterium]